MADIVTPFSRDNGRMPAPDSSDHPAGALTGVDREAHDWVMRFASGEARPVDLAAFKRWSAHSRAHAEAFARACRLWEALAPASDMLAGRSRARLPERKVNIGRRAFLGGALAASVAGTFYVTANPPLGLWPSLSELAADYRTAPGEQRSIALSEGPSVTLNTRTSVALKTVFDGTQQIELIGGEAAIATNPRMRQAIEVVAADGHVAATDAAFNVRYEHDIVCTTCISGELVVVHGVRSVRLRRGEQVVYSVGGLGEVATIDPALVTSWKDGMLVFQSTPLADAVSEINRYRSGRIIVTNATLGRRLFNARFRIANIDGVVTQIQQVFGASVTALPGGIILLG